MMIHVAGLLHYEFMSEGCNVNREMYVKLLCHLRNAVRRKYVENGHETTGFFWMITLVTGGQKASCQAKCDGFAASAMFPGFLTAQLVSMTKRFSEKTVIH
jgi:hypothetical protein